MTEKYLIKNTTRKQREDIVKNSIMICGDVCDGCAGCEGLGMGSWADIYAPYIEGKKELHEINRDIHGGIVK